MKKSSKPTILLLLILLLIAAAFLLVGVGIKLKYERVVLQKDNLEKSLNAASLKKIQLTADYQSVSTEERIVFIASKELGLVRRVDQPTVIKVENEKIEKVDEALRKYNE